tara:strand:+ start:536 stop:730 length:195 start_codon:yes stop_codon:yes gene_type:complete
MYQFICGFCFGAYVATKYDLGPYVDTAEFAMKRFLKEAEKKAQDLKQEQTIDEETGDNVTKKND